MKNKSGWYHDTEFDSPGEIWFCEDPLGPCAQSNEFHSQLFYGPFKTFGDAKADAIDYHKTDIETARRCIQNLRAIKKPKKKVPS